MLILDPERNDVAEAVEVVVDTYALVGNLEINERGRSAREERESDSGKNDEDAKEEVVEEDAREECADSHDPERPEPVAAALDMIMLVRAPMYGHVVGHLPQ